jgi:cytochrome P450
MTAELAGLLLAGHEALGHSLAWSLYLLAAHKDAQVSAREDRGWTTEALP